MPETESKVTRKSREFGWESHVGRLDLGLNWEAANSPSYCLGAAAVISISKLPNSRKRGGVRAGKKAPEYAITALALAAVRLLPWFLAAFVGADLGMNLCLESKHGNTFVPIVPPQYYSYLYLFCPVPVLATGAIVGQHRLHSLPNPTALPEQRIFCYEARQKSRLCKKDLF